MLGRARSVAALLAVAAVAAVAGCGLVAGLSTDYGVGVAGGASADGAAADGASDSGAADGAAGDARDGGGGPDAAPDATGGPGPCTGLPGPAMVVASSLSGGPSFCVDATEVTEAQYGAFLDAGVTVQQGLSCAWNTSFDPTKIETGECSNYRLAAPARPIRCVDWCDAVAYCASVGKRLCGRRGGGGLTLPTDDPANPAKDQWLVACSGGDSSRAFPYGGSTYHPGRCVDNTNGPADVMSQPRCEGTPSGLFDMSGNVAEWEDACDTAGADVSGQNCKTRGGDFASVADDKALRCWEVSAQAQRKATLLRVGFRCCKD